MKTGDNVKIISAMYGLGTAVLGDTGVVTAIDESSDFVMVYVARVDCDLTFSANDLELVQIDTPDTHMRLSVKLVKQLDEVIPRLETATRSMESRKNNILIALDEAVREVHYWRALDRDTKKFVGQIKSFEERNIDLRLNNILDTYFSDIRAGEDGKIRFVVCSERVNRISFSGIRLNFGYLWIDMPIFSGSIGNFIQSISVHSGNTLVEETTSIFQHPHVRNYIPCLGSYESSVYEALSKNPMDMVTPAVKVASMLCYGIDSNGWWRHAYNWAVDKDQRCMSCFRLKDECTCTVRR